jgi:small ligand-binding sensory domain FIST
VTQRGLRATWSTTQTHDRDGSGRREPACWTHADGVRSTVIYARGHVRRLAPVLPTPTGLPHDHLVAGHDRRVGVPSRRGPPESTLNTTAALSRTAEADIAAAEAADAVGVALRAQGPDRSCDLAVVFVSQEHHEHLASVAAAVEARLEPGVLLGAVAQGVIGPDHEVGSGPAVSVWAASGMSGSLQPFRAWTLRPSGGGLAVAGWPDTAPDDVTLVLADPASFPASQVLDRVGEQRPGHVVVGGLVTGGPGRAGLLLDDRVHEDGAVGVVLHGAAIGAVVSQGCRPVGEPLTVTGAVRDRVLELGGEPATSRLQELLEQVDDTDRALLRGGGLHLGVVVHEARDAYRTGDFLVRGVLGIEPASGALTIGDTVEVGRTVQFHVRDAASASAELQHRLTSIEGVAGGLLFSCTGRGARLFGEPDHDLAAVRARVRGGVAGAFCAAEIGPVGARSYVHAFTASVAAFGHPSGA